MLKHLPMKILMLLALIFSGSVMFGQTGSVSGTVSDANDGTTLPGATVVVKGTAKGTSTDMDGKFSLEISPNTALIISYVGYKTQEIVADPNTTVSVSLEPEATGLDEIVVIGYGTQKKSDATGSVTPISSQEFNKGSIVTPASLITGKVAGVSVINAGGAPGEGAQIRIRGGSSLTASNDPLIVVDGVPMDNTTINGGRSPLNTINPNDIETFTVLKDASATAIYGSRASNGVILITTKKGEIGNPLKIEYNGNFSLYTPTKTTDVLGADEFRSLVEERYPDYADMLGDANTNWQDQIYTNAFGMDHNLSFTGATKHMPYRVSLGYENQDGILKTDNMNRTTLNFSLNPSFLEDHLTVSLNGQGAYIKNRFANRGAIGAATQFDPTKPVYDDPNAEYYVYDTLGNVIASTNYGGYWEWLQSNQKIFGTDTVYENPPVGQATRNPLALLNLRKDISNVYNFRGNAKVDYKIHGFEDLTLHLNLGLDYSKSNGTVKVPAYVGQDYDVLYDGGGLDNSYEQERKNQLLDFYGNYTKHVDAIKSDFEVMAGYSWQHFYVSDYSINTNVAHTVSSSVTDTIDNKKEYYLISLFGRFNYTLADKYLLTFTLRNDNTSRFAPGNRSGWFPSVALAWKINEETFLRDSKVLSQLKLRLGWGVTGQQDVGNDYYPYLPIYTLSQTTASYILGGDTLQTLRAEGYNADLKWEETTTWNVGLDFGFSQDRYYGSVDVYYRKTTDLLNEIPVAAGTNLTNYILSNIGDLINKGVEFSIFTRPIVKNDLRWEVGFNATYNHNEITKLTAYDDSTYLGVETGGISGGVGNNIQIHSVGYPANSFFVYEQVYDNNGNPIEGLYVDRNGDGEITSADKYHYHKPAADFWFGINSTLDWKNWEFAFSGRANFGNYVYNNVASSDGVYERLYRSEGPYLSNISTFVYGTNFISPQYQSDYYIKEASFFKMDYMTLSYIFRSIGGSKINLRLTGTVNNAFTITNYEGIDPEIQNGIDNNIYPRPRAYVLSVNLQF